MLNHFGFQNRSKFVSVDKKEALGFQNVPDGSIRIQWSVHVRPMVAKAGHAGFKRGSKEPKMSPRWRQRRPRMDQRETQGSTKGPQEAKKKPKRVQRRSSRDGKVAKKQSKTHKFY